MTKKFGFAILLLVSILATFLVPAKYTTAFIIAPPICPTYWSDQEETLFSDYQNVSYNSDGLLQMRLKLAPDGIYNDGRAWRADVTLYDSDCNIKKMYWSFDDNISLPAGTVNYSVKFISPTHFQIWNDDINQIVNCPTCDTDFTNENLGNNLQVSFFGKMQRDAVYDPVTYEETRPRESSNINSATFPILNPNPPQATDPVIIIPGILGSAQKNGEWIIDPIFHTYDDLIDTLAANGYEKGKDLFPFPYNWRFSNVLTAVALRDKIREVKTICQCDKVDIVAHSMGGLVARQYIQSDYYDNDVDQLIFLGTPHLGAPKAYLPWEGANVPPKDIPYQVLKFLLSREASKLDYDLFDYIRQNVISIQQLLPVYDYIKDSGSDTLRTYPDNYPRNTFLENLNANVDKLNNSGVRVTNIVGDTGTSTVGIIRVIPSPSLPLWEHGRPEGFNIILSDNGLENGRGDETVPVKSASFIDLNSIVISSKHTDIPSNAEGDIFKVLSGKNATILSHHGQIDFKLLIIQILSPADIQIIAPDGKKVGKDFATGQEINEIPGAFYSGFLTDDEYVAIPNPLDGEYKVVTQGTGGGGGYTVATGYITDTGSAESDFKGQTLPDMISTIDVTISSASPNSLIITPEDNVPPVITITSPTSKDYLRSDKFVINATSTDTGSGIFSFEMLLDGKMATSGKSVDLFYEKLGTHKLSATSTDFMSNVATSSAKFRIIATPESTISDIERTYSLGWITKKQAKESLIRQIKAMIKLEKKIDKIESKDKNGKKITKLVERIEKRIDKVLAKALQIELRLYQKQKLINNQAHELLQEDIKWLIDNY